MDVYYDGLAFEDDAKFDADGWENGFLDDYLRHVQAAKSNAEELQVQRKRVEESRLSLRVRDRRSASPDNSYRTENGLEADRGVVEEALPDQDTIGSVVDHLEGAHPDQSQRPHRVAGDSDPGLVHHQDHI
ncbi:hypothetical protein VKS41_008197 [Umbelopsis sp. WA50703]